MGGKGSCECGEYAYDGVEVLDGKIYFVAGYNGSDRNIAERYDPLNDTWETLSPMSVARARLLVQLLMTNFMQLAVRVYQVLRVLIHLQNLGQQARHYLVK